MLNKYWMMFPALFNCKIIFLHCIYCMFAHVLSNHRVPMWGLAGITDNSIVMVINLKIIGLVAVQSLQTRLEVSAWYEFP